MEIRHYATSDYPTVKKIYEDAGWFDPQTDSEERINTKSVNDPESILVALDTDEIAGTVSLIEDGRIALFFRLVTKNLPDASEIRKELIKAGEAIFKKRGYKEAHIIILEEDLERQKEYEENGFQKGKSYKWMWKKL